MFKVTASANTLTELFLQEATPISDTVFRINASYSGHANPTYRELGSMFGTAVSNKMSILAGSVDHVGEVRGSKVVSFLAVANTINKPMTDAENGRMSLISANVFLDNEDETVWKAFGEGKNRRLVQASKEDYKALLHSRLARRSGTMITASTVAFNHGIRPDVGDFVMAYDVVAGAYDFGFALPVQGGKVVVASYKDGGILKEVSPLAIVESANLFSQAPGVVPDHIARQLQQGRTNILASGALDAVLDPTEGDFTAPMANSVLTYWSSLYKGTGFFNTLTKLVEERRRIAKEDAPLSTMQTV